MCQPDNLKFKRFVNQLGFAFAPSAMHSARTTGYGGFDVSVEGTYTKISNNKDYWKLGTQGSGDPSTNLAAIRNNSPESLLQLYSVRVRKGFGFGLEVSGMVGFMPKTSLLGGGADVRLSLLEGFRRGLLGIFPDVAVGLVHGRLATVEERIRSGPRGEIFTTLEKLAADSALKVDSMEPRTSPASDSYRETKVQVALKGVTLPQLVNYLHRIDSSEQVLSIKSLRIRSRKDKPDLLDVTFTVSSFEPA